MKKTSRNTSRPTKVLYVGNFHPQSVSEPEIAWCLEQRGFEVTRVDFRKNSLQQLEELVPGHDFLLCSKFNVGGLDIAATRFIKECKIPTVSWSFDLYWGYHREPKVFSEPHFNCNLVLTTDGGHDEKWR